MHRMYKWQKTWLNSMLSLDKRYRKFYTTNQLVNANQEKTISIREGTYVKARNRYLAGLLTYAMALSMGAGSAVWAENATEAETEVAVDDYGILTEIAGEDGTTYVNLFKVILDDVYEDYWVEKCTSIVGEEQGKDTAEMLRAYISADIYGSEAAEEYEKNPEALGFDCWYINGAESFTFRGDEITTTLEDGTESTHTYEYLGTYKVGEGETMMYQGQEIDPSFECDVYKSTDDAGEFTYFLMRDDTMESTYHIEFRYGSDLEALQKYFTGEYAYWLSAGIDADADEETIHNVIDLFITENTAAEE